MQARSWIRIAQVGMFTTLVAVIFFAWREDRHDRAQLTAELAAAHQALAAADSRQHDRDAQLQQTLATLAAQKHSVQTPAQILTDLPRQLPLPKPLIVEQKPLPDTPIARPGEKANPGPRVVVPTEDLKPLYDFTLDCKVCQAKLAAAQADLADEQLKTSTLTKERDAALKSAKGGSFLRRVGRAAKWFAIGAAAGALAAKSAHH